MFCHLSCPLYYFTVLTLGFEHLVFGGVCILYPYYNYLCTLSSVMCFYFIFCSSLSTGITYNRRRFLGTRVFGWKRNGHQERYILGFLNKLAGLYKLCTIILAFLSVIVFRDKAKEINALVRHICIIFLFLFCVTILIFYDAFRW